jgi:hypothetical protein
VFLWSSWRLLVFDQVEKLEQLSEHILETAGPDAEILQVSDSHLWIRIA